MYKNLVISLLFVLCIFLLSLDKCNNCIDVSNLESTHTITIDTVYIDTFNKHTGLLPKVKTIVTDTTKIKEILNISNIDSGTPSIYQHVTHVKDSIINGKITSFVSGELYSTDFEYSIKIPQITIRDSSVRYMQKNLLLIGIESGYKKGMFHHISPTVEFVKSNKFAIQYRYEINPSFGNSHNVGIKCVILNNRKK